MYRWFWRGVWIYTDGSIQIDCHEASTIFDVLVLDFWMARYPITLGSLQLSTNAELIGIGAAPSHLASQTDWS